ncbi:MAG: class I SAM-dependent methyltransferase [Gemmatimonadetes bacterium]|nr:class I SAM-dependent methyltransferase [Gemmatimonadota bacterium]
MALAGRYASVLATDASDRMIAEATAHPRVRYAVTDYTTGLEPHSVGIVTVAQALHWLDLDALIREARRVLVPDGLLAAWCYSRCRVSPEVDAVFDHFI